MATNVSSLFWAPKIGLNSGCVSVSYCLLMVRVPSTTISREKTACNCPAPLPPSSRLHGTRPRLFGRAKKRNLWGFIGPFWPRLKITPYFWTFLHDSLFLSMAWGFGWVINFGLLISSWFWNLRIALETVQEGARQMRLYHAQAFCKKNQQNFSHTDKKVTIYLLLALSMTNRPSFLWWYAKRMSRISSI